MNRLLGTTVFAPVEVGYGRRPNFHFRDFPSGAIDRHQVSHADRPLEQNNDSRDEIRKNLLQSESQSNGHRRGKPLHAGPRHSNHSKAHDHSDEHREVTAERNDRMPRPIVDRQPSQDRQLKQTWQRPGGRKCSYKCNNGQDQVRKRNWHRSGNLLALLGSVWQGDCLVGRNGCAPQLDSIKHLQSRKHVRPRQPSYHGKRQYGRASNKLYQLPMDAQTYPPRGSAPALPANPQRSCGEAT